MGFEARRSLHDASRSRFPSGRRVRVAAARRTGSTSAMSTVNHGIVTRDRALRCSRSAASTGDGNAPRCSQPRHRSASRSCAASQRAPSCHSSFGCDRGGRAGTSERRDTRAARACRRADNVGSPPRPPRESGGRRPRARRSARDRERPAGARALRPIPLAKCHTSRDTSTLRVVGARAGRRDRTRAPRPESSPATAARAKPRMAS